MEQPRRARGKDARHLRPPMKLAFRAATRLDGEGVTRALADSAAVLCCDEDPAVSAYAVREGELAWRWAPASDGDPGGGRRYVIVTGVVRHYRPVRLNVPRLAAELGPVELLA